MYTYKKNERLANYRLQSLLFNDGSNFFLHPFRVQWICLSHDSIKDVFPAGIHSTSTHFKYPAKCLIGASKRQLKKAVKRNRAKRLVKEAYRKNKSYFYAFLNTKGLYVLLALIYTSKKMLPFNAIEVSLQDVLQTIMIQIGDNASDAE